jgi:hypothetical protein
MSIDKMSIDKMSIDKMSIDKMSIDKMSIDKMLIDKMLIDKIQKFLNGERLVLGETAAGSKKPDCFRLSESSVSCC